jgi:hypothetical protein
MPQRLILPAPTLAPEWMFILLIFCNGNGVVHLTMLG